jgi:hypothetical protein
MRHGRGGDVEIHTTPEQVVNEATGSSPEPLLIFEHLEMLIEVRVFSAMSSTVSWVKRGVSTAMEFDNLVWLVPIHG